MDLTYENAVRKPISLIKVLIEASIVGVSTNTGLLTAREAEGPFLFREVNKLGVDVPELVGISLITKLADKEVEGAQLACN